MNKKLCIFFKNVFNALANIIKNTILLSFFCFCLIKYMIFPNLKYNIFFLEIWLGQKCTLKCKYCWHLIPYLKNKVSYDVEEIINDLKIILKAVNVKTLSIVGGEPFIHDNLCRFLEFVSSCDEIENINFTTNMTVIPDEKVLNMLKRLNISKRVFITGSDYKDLSCHKDFFIKFANDNNIGLNIDYIGEGSFWNNFKIPGQKRSIKFWRTLLDFKSCGKRFCNSLVNGNLSICSRGHVSSLVFNFKNFFLDVPNIRKIKYLPLLKACIATSLNNKIYKEYCKHCCFSEPSIIPGKNQL